MINVYIYYAGWWMLLLTSSGVSCARASGLELPEASGTSTSLDEGARSPQFQAMVESEEYYNQLN
jgi:hypothetical protein